MATKKTSVSPEFLYVPIGNIVVLEQVRSNINIEADSFKTLVQSIKDSGSLRCKPRMSRPHADIYRYHADTRYQCHPE